SVIAWRLGFTSATLAQSTPGQPTCQAEQRRFVLHLPPTGREVFLPSLDPQRVYEIAVQGVCPYSYDIGIFSKRYVPKHSDAFYCTAIKDDFLEPHDRLMLDGVPMRRLFHNA